MHEMGASNLGYWSDGFVSKFAGSPDPDMLGLRHQVQTAPVVALVSLELDQLTKLAVKESVPVGESIPLATGLHIANIMNPGGVLGVPVPFAVSLLLPLVMIAGAVVLYWRFGRSKSALLNVGTGLFVGGSVGNVVDRIAYGHVSDFIELTSSTGYSRTVFNLADLCIIAGIVIIEVFLIRLVLKVRERSKDGPVRRSTQEDA
jgi:signal peptidase II